MPIVGFNFDKILAEKKAQLKKGMKAAHNITINSVNEEELVMGQNSKKIGLKFSFEYNVDYQPNIGEILIKGHLLYTDEDKKIKDILSKWKKEKKIDNEVTAHLINTAIVKSTIKAFSLSQDVNLPPHLPIPTVAKAPTRSNKANEYIG